MKIVITAILLSLSLATFADNIDLFVWAGQSNALGRQGNATGYPADVNGHDPMIRFNWTVANGSSSGGWTTMQSQVGFFPTGHFGPEVTFGRKLVQAAYDPAIFKFTQGATSLFQHWQGPGDGGLYDSLVTDLNIAITALQNQGHVVTVKGLIWIQGESDSNSPAAAAAYFNNLTIIINDFRTNVVNNVNLPIILGVDEQFFNVTNQEEHAILNAHQDIALNDSLIKFTSMYGYPKADVTHLTPAGLISHGEDLFDSFQLLISGQKPSSTCTLASAGAQVSFTRAAWGQSFTTDCSGLLSAITFSAATSPASAATFTLHNGADCSGTILFTQALGSITIGDNIVSVNNGLYLEKEHTYYLNIVSNTNALWGVNYSNTTNVFGMLRTFRNGNNCDRSFPSFDMDFSVELVGLNSCANASNIYAFSYNGTNYEIVKENKSWADAAACAMARGGVLAEINSLGEQNAIFNELQNNAGIVVANTVAPDGGGASYAWIGANDISSEGQWVWDGGNTGNTVQFWQGGVAGVPVNGLYNNWGNEPDNSGNNQDAAGIGLTQWPIGSGSLGSAGQWNDVDHTNTLYYVIERSATLGIEDFPGLDADDLENLNKVKVYPNPVGDLLTIDNFEYAISGVEIINALGQTIGSTKPKKSSDSIEIDFSNFNNGIYFIKIKYMNGKLITRKIVK